MTLKHLLLGGPAVLVIALAMAGIYAKSRISQPRPQADSIPMSTPSPSQLALTSDAATAQATFGGGCFWCTEAVFQQLQGVRSVVSGYSGGHVKNPTYQEVCNGDTGHAEAIQVTYDPNLVSYEDLLEVFWKTHDPTTPNQQGADFGPQYRSVIFYHDDQQRRLAKEYKQKLDTAGVFAAPIVTEISPFSEFYPAEDYHQRYFERNPNQMYCRVVIGPKLEKFQKVFKDKLKPGAK
jgi:peptide-methionine (S)-S-oxide reductase